MGDARVTVDRIVDWENGELDEASEADFFQGLIDTDMAWTLQGCYGRHAARLIEAGHCHRKGQE
jgi:hypothetical protein